MGRRRHPYVSRPCAKCADPVPEWRRSDAAYCSEQCRDAAEKARYCARNLAYVRRQRELVARLHHLREHGHTDYLTHPIGNPKDRFRVARSLGYRSMLEVDLARQLEAAGIAFEYEKFKVAYLWHPNLLSLLES